jgi:hypothetical protein
VVGSRIRYSIFLDNDYVKREFPAKSSDASPEEVWEKWKAGRTGVDKLLSKASVGLLGAFARP